MKTLEINRFDGGIAQDERTAQSNEAGNIIHFDPFSKPSSLVPQISTTDNNTGQGEVGHVIVGSDGLFYGLGGDTGNPGKQEIYKKATHAGDWAEIPSGNSLSGKTVNYTTFVEYKDYFYTLDTNRYVMRFDRAGVASTASTYSDLTSFATNAQGLIHPHTDQLFIPYDNKIWSLNAHAGTPVIADITLPNHLKITAIAPYGSYLAIMCVSKNESTSAGSTLFLWDMVADDVTETIQWGNGITRVLNNLNGTLIGITDFGGSLSETLYSDKLVIKGYRGGTPFLIKEYQAKHPTSGTASVTVYPRVSFINDEKMYFSADVYGSDAQIRKRGLWVVYQNRNGNYACAIERVGAASSNDPVNILSAAIIGDRVLSVYTAVGTISITTSGASIAYGTGRYESPKFLNSRKKKNLVSVWVTFEGLPSGAAAAVYYKKDGETSYTSIGSEDTDGAVFQEFSTRLEFNEIQFEITSAGGAVITGYGFNYEELTGLTN